MTINNQVLDKKYKLPEDLFEDEATKIFVSYEDSGFTYRVIYLTNTKCNMYQRECEEYNNLLFFGTVNIIGNDWLSKCEKLKNIDFYGLSLLREVGSNWLSYAENLNSVGSKWLSDCKNLKIVNFSGLSNLTDVGNFKFFIK